jgi:sarcosine oxidase, subunit beta
MWWSMSDRLANAEVTDAVVLGAGVIGSSVALELARTGRRVLVLDKNGGVGHGSTSASSALVRFNYSTLAGVATAWESKFCWEAWADHLGHRDEAGLARFHRVGVLHLDVPVLPRQRSLALLREVGVPYEELEADEIAARFPQLDPGRYWPNKPVTDDAFWDASSGSLGGYLTPDGGYVDDPQLAAHNLAAAAVAHGATLRLRTEVCGLDRDGEGWLVRTTTGGVVRTPVVVNAAGPWSGQVNRMAGVGDDFTIGVRPMRQEVHHVPLSAQGGEPSLIGPAVFDLDLGTYMRTGPTGDFLVGGTEPECDPLEWLDDPDVADPRVTRERYEAQTFRAARRLPGLRVPGTPSGVAGVYDVAEDWTPIYDKTGAPGFFVAMGTSGNQFKNAPLAGRFLATIVEHEHSGRDHDVTPAQYVGEHTGQVIDLVAFSRKRPVNTASSGTVMG